MDLVQYEYEYEYADVHVRDADIPGYKPHPEDILDILKTWDNPAGIYPHPHSGPQGLMFVGRRGRSA